MLGPLNLLRVTEPGSRILTLLSQVSPTKPEAWLLGPLKAIVNPWPPEGDKLLEPVQLIRTLVLIFLFPDVLPLSFFVSPYGGYEISPGPGICSPERCCLGSSFFRKLRAVHSLGGFSIFPQMSSLVSPPAKSGFTQVKLHHAPLVIKEKSKRKK